MSENAAENMQDGVEKDRNMADELQDLMQQFRELMAENTELKIHLAVLHERQRWIRQLERLGLDWLTKPHGEADAPTMLLIQKSQPETKLVSAQEQRRAID
jgi:regulator of replication initiation timing